MLESLEFVLICMPDGDGARAMLPALDIHRRTKSAMVVDLLAITKDAAGLVTLRTFAELPERPMPAYGSRPGDPATLFTAEDVATLATGVPLASSATVMLLEHRRVGDLAAAIERAGGEVLVGGLVAPETLARVRAELEMVAVTP